MAGPDEPTPQGWTPADGQPAPGGQPPQGPPGGQYPPPAPAPGQYPPPPPQTPYYPPPGQGPQYPPGVGAGPYGGAPAAAMGYGMGPYGAPPQRRSGLKWALIALGVVVVLIIAVVVAATVLTRDNITRIDDVAVGSCITVTGEKDDATPKKAQCGSQSFNFIVAIRIDSQFGTCGDPIYAQLTQEDRGKLCLVPNLRTGKCYVFPSANGSIVDFAETDCATASSRTGNPVIKVIDRIESDNVGVCTSGTALRFDRPGPMTYCATLLTPQ